MSDLIPSWSGTLERQGKAAGLSRYLGPSQLACYVDKRVQARRDQLESKKLAAHVSKQPVGPLPSPQQVRQRITFGYSLRRIAWEWRVPVAVIRKLKDTY